MGSDGQFFRDLVESANDWMWQINDFGVFLYSSPQAEALLGHTAADLAGTSRFDLMPAPEAQRVARLFAHHSRERRPIAGIESENRHKDGRRILLETRAEPYYDTAGVYCGYRGVDRDVTARRRAEEALQNLSAHLVNDRERRKAEIARELHDEMGGALAALNVDVHWLAELLPSTASEHQRLRAQDMIDLIERALGTVRRITTELRPAILDDLGLQAAVEWQVDAFRRRSGIDCRLSLATEERPAGAIALALFRILQESLTNILRHACATRVDVELWSAAGALVLEISDNGIGMNTARAESDGHGLIGMRERARGLGGALEITSRPGRGVTVSVRLPHSGATR